jgi:hypothetical protein
MLGVESLEVVERPDGHEQRERRHRHEADLDHDDRAQHSRAPQHAIVAHAPFCHRAGARLNRDPSGTSAGLRGYNRTAAAAGAGVEWLARAATHPTRSPCSSS